MSIISAIILKSYHLSLEFIEHVNHNVLNKIANKGGRLQIAANLELMACVAFNLIFCCLYSIEIICCCIN